MFNEELIKRAENNDFDAMVELAHCYYLGDGVEVDDDKAFALFGKIIAIDPNHVKTIRNLGCCHRGGYGTAVDNQKAIEYFSKGCDFEDADCLWALAEYLYNGEYIEKDTKKAFELTLKAAEKGVHEAQEKLGEIYREGELVPQDYTEANKWFKLAAEQNNSNAYYWLASAYYNGLGVEKDLPKSSELWEKSAELGHWGSQFITGLNYEKGEGVVQNINTAIEWYTKSAEQGHSDACYNLAQIYRVGIDGATIDTTKAIYYYERAVEFGNLEAMFTLGVLYFNGQCGLSKDEAKAFELWLKGSEANHLGCAKNVGICYKSGAGIEQDTEKAISYFEKALSLGSIDAMVELGAAYDDNGIAVTDYIKSSNYYAEAYASGSEIGAFCLGMMYELGKGVEKDLSRAFELYKFASEKNYPRAVVKMGIFYHDGLGVEKDISKSVECFERAKAMGDPDADNMLAFIYKKDTVADGTDPVKAFEFNLKRANEGDAEAQFLVFKAYDDGVGVEENRELAHEWLKKAADNGHVSSQALMGFYEMLKSRNSSAVEYWEKASAGGNLKAANDLAGLYLDGYEDIPMNKARAIELLSFAVENNYPDSQVVLGRCYLLGNGVEKNPSMGIQLFLKAAETNNEEAQKMLGCCYLHGDGVVKDVNSAISWFEKAAEQGNLFSKFMLAEMFSTDEYVAPQYLRAEQLYREIISKGEGEFYEDSLFSLAYMFTSRTSNHYAAFPLWKELAEKGNSGAQYNLGLCYYHGRGTEKDYNLAKHWWSLSAEQGDEKAKNNLEVLEDEMRNNNYQSSTSSQSGGGCYIATAVYGSYDCPEVWTLRRYRDYTLSESLLGRIFIKTYYSISPTIVRWFGKTKWFNFIWKKVLDRMVGSLRENGVESTPYEDKKY